LSDQPLELPAVAALRTLSIFGVDQGGAYREHYGPVAEVLGADVPTRLSQYAREWAAAGAKGCMIMTGNAGTGKTAVAEAYCRSHGQDLPSRDGPVTLDGGQLVIKDLSGLPGGAERATALRDALTAGRTGQALVCANEGVLRDACEELGGDAGGLADALDEALRRGAAEDGDVLVLNVNRQRPTSRALWQGLIDLVAREELWEPGCKDCPGDGPGATGCPMRENAAALRRDGPREALRQLMQLGAGEAVPTMREVLAILAWAIVGDQSCEKVKSDARDRGPDAHTAVDAYFHRALGGGLKMESAERSPLLAGMRASGLGSTSDLQADEWLRDAQAAPPEVQALAGFPTTSSPHDRVSTGAGCRTFNALGEAISTSEDLPLVQTCLAALVGLDGEGAQALWRRRLFFEATDALGGTATATARMLDVRYLADFLDLASAVAAGADEVLRLAELVEGLNFLVCGFSSAADGLIVPDQACLFSRDPGSFRPARPSLVHASVQVGDLALRAPDQGVVENFLDVDHLDLELEALGDARLCLRIRPRLYEAIREAAAFQGPVGQGIAEMTDVRGFYGRLAESLGAGGLRVADPEARPPSLQPLRLPHFG
jgi:hypothetical protein